MFDSRMHYQVPIIDPDRIQFTNRFGRDGEAQRRNKKHEEARHGKTREEPPSHLNSRPETPNKRNLKKKVKTKSSLKYEMRALQTEAPSGVSIAMAGNVLASFWNFVVEVVTTLFCGESEPLRHRVKKRHSSAQPQPSSSSPPIISPFAQAIFICLVTLPCESCQNSLTSMADCGCLSGVLGAS
ncbi:hypothetical protein BDZ45DRAFT_429803 [Acephala macrosclerotiorum]|nr:hypothetical protein BDZ45DRAFT_429803 [Acephala macrosclerotiorum]